MDKYRLEVAVDRALAEFNSLSEAEQSPLNMMMLARKYAPSNIKSCTDILGDPDYRWMYVFESKPGHLLLDTVIATVTSYIATSLDFKVNQERMNQQMEEARRPKILR